jgi:GNAT superfamily N-acetyltransferase
MRLAICRVEGDDDLATVVALVNSITPDDPASLEELRWADATYPGGSWFLAEVDGRAVGVASVGRIYVQAADYPDLWGSIAVEPGSRRQGIGSVLLQRISDAARAAGKQGLQGRVSADRPEAVAFLAKRGFTEDERSKTVRLELAGLEPPDLSMPPGTILTDLAARPELVHGVHAVAVEAFVDIPWTDEPMAVGDFDEFRARDVDRPGILPEAFMVALDETSGEVVGYASLMLVPGSTTTAWHDMTAVRRAWRGRGLATALKRASIRWAIDRGLEALDTGNDEHNAAMRAVNARLGYVPLPDEIFVRGPLLPPG